MLEEYGKEIIIGALSAGGAFLFTYARNWYKSADRAKAKAEAVGRAAEKREEILQRRAEDKFVLKEVCEKCEAVRETGNKALEASIENLRGYVDGIDKKTDRIGDDIRQIRDHILKGASHA